MGTVTVIYPGGKRRDITRDRLGREVVAYLAAARRQGLSGGEIEDDIYDALSRSPVPADDVRVRGGVVEIELFDLD